MEARQSPLDRHGTGLLIMWMSLNLPPGSRTTDLGNSAVAIWHGVGGPTWGVLAACGLFAWVGLTLAKANHPLVTQALAVRIRKSVPAWPFSRRIGTAAVGARNSRGSRKRHRKRWFGDAPVHFSIAAVYTQV